MSRGAYTAAMFKAIIFDFDGVIVDSEPLHFRAFLRVARSLGITFDYQGYLRDYVGYDDRDAFRAMLEANRQAELAHDPKQLADLCQRKAHAFEAIVNEGVDPIPGAVELVREAHGVLPIAIASGATRADIDLILARLDLADAFAVITTADDVPQSKPDPRTYRIAFERLAAAHPDAQLEPASCLAIEDTAAGIASARGAGLMTLGLNTLGDAGQLRDAQRVVASLRGIDLGQLQQWYG